MTKALRKALAVLASVAAAMVIAVLLAFLIGRTRSTRLTPSDMEALQSGDFWTPGELEAMRRTPTGQR